NERIGNAPRCSFQMPNSLTIVSHSGQQIVLLPCDFLTAPHDTSSSYSSSCSGISGHWSAGFFLIMAGSFPCVFDVI
ncbi:MAG: hypothetical protein QMB69_00450, partial [Candidatus Nanopelagicales bacterium]